MHNRSQNGGLMLALVLAVLLPQYIFATGWRSAYLPGSALALSLAGSGTALTPQVELASINPVHVWGETVESVDYSRLQMFGDLKSHNLRWQGNYRKRPTQFELRSVTEAGLELRNGPTKDPLGKFSARYFSAAVFRGAQLGPVQLGLGLTYAYQRMYEYAASSLTVAIGASSNISKWLRLGGAVSGFGIAQKLHVEKPDLPLRVNLGAALQMPWQGGVLAADAVYDSETNWHPSIAYQHTGGFFSFTTGVRLYEEELLITGGAELRHGKWSLAYAIGYQNAALGQPQMFSFKRKF